MDTHTRTHMYKKGGTAGGKRIGGKRRELARISTIYTHVGGTAVAVAVAISSIFRFSPFPGSLPSSTDLPYAPPPPACLLPPAKRLDGLSPLYFRTGLNHRRGFPAVFAADEKGSGLYLARRTLHHCRDYSAPPFRRFR